MKDNFIFTVDIEAFNDSVVPKDLPIKKKKRKNVVKYVEKRKQFY